MSGNPTRIAPPKFDQRNEQHTRSSVETRLRSSESFLDNEVRLFKADFTLANGANSNLELPSVARFLRVTGPTGAFSISGFAGGYDNKRLIVFNPTAQTMTITNNATSTAANRILTLTGADVPMAGPGMAPFIYSVSDERWLLEDAISATLNATTVELGGTTDTTLSRASAGVAAVEGVNLLRATQNLLDVSSVATAFANIKQAATDAATGVVELATNAEALAGADATRAVTSAGLASNKSLAAEGHMALPGGLMLKWGVTGAVSGGAAYSFPTAFPTACFMVLTTPDTSARSTGVSAFDASGFTYTMNISTSGAASSARAYYIALGN
jgi:hypothetical protein